MPPAAFRLRDSLRRLTDWALRRPVLATFLVALGARLLFAIATILATDGAVIPDEYQYLDIAEWASQGRLGPEVWQGYGRSMYGSVDAFLFPLTILFRIFWPWRLFGHLLTALAGAVAAAVTARLGLSRRDGRTALLGGLLVALVPSQILWSGVVLRESAVWLGAALPAVLLLAASRTTSARRLLLLGLAAGACVYYLANLRDQTAIAAAWAFAAAAIVMPARRRVVVAAGAVAVAVVSLWMSNLGPGGYDVIRHRAPSLATTRAQLAVNAESAFVPDVVDPIATIPATSTANPREAPDEVDDEPTVDEGGATTTLPPPSSYGWRTPGTVIDSTGTRYVVDESIGADFKALPRGLIATMLRPFPWEGTDGIALAFARLENIGWYVLYVLAAIGIWLGRRRLDVIAYPTLTVLSVAVIAALTQGNLGTAFRHRAQILWALALLASSAVIAFADHRRRRRDAAMAVVAEARDRPVSPALVGR